MKVGSGSFVFHIIPATDVPANEKVAPQDLLEKRLHDKSASLLTQVSGMFVAATSMFTTLAREAAATSSRIQQLQQRIDNLHAQVPQVEQLCGSGMDFSRNQRAEFKGERSEESQLFKPGTVAESVKKRHLANPPVPDMSPLDRYRPDKLPCIMFYTYPQFFMDEWVREQEKEMAERQARNAERRAERAARHQHNAPAAASVKQVMKRVYDVDTGQLITVAAAEQGAGVERRAPAAQQTQSKQPQTYAAQSFPPPPSFGAGAKAAPSPVAASFPPPPSISSSAKAAPRPFAGPPPLGSAPTPQARVSPRPGMGAPAPPMQFQPAPPPPMQNQFAAPNPSYSNQASFAPPPAPAAPAFVPPPAPAGPPPPAAPPPPPAGSLAAQLEAVKVQTAASSGGGGGGLLDSIKAGVQLKKAAPIEERPVAAEVSGGFNVAAILARRAALEMSDEESSGGEWD